MINHFFSHSPTIFLISDFAKFCCQISDTLLFLYQFDCCDDIRKAVDRKVCRLAICRRAARGLLAGLWQFPNESGHLEAEEAVLWAENRGLHPRNVERSIDRHHIFTHIRWDMRAWFLEVDEAAGGFTWLTLQQIDEQAALPTAFRQFREEI